jgi:hypothetical protein
MAKATDAEVERRVDEVYDLLINRVTYRAIVGYGAQKWGLKERQVAVYIGKAKERILLRAKESQEEQLAKAIASYESLYARQVAEKDLSGARQTLDSLVRLLGLAAPDKQELMGSLALKGYVGMDLKEDR